jgi:general secretion pathway protein D
MSIPLLLARGLAALLLPLLAACVTTPQHGPQTRSPPHELLTRIASEEPPDARAPAGSDAERTRIFKGSGVLVKGQQPGGVVPPGAPPAQPGGGGVVLNFEGADLREVVRNILGDILNESYTIDPTVGGQVTIRTSSGVPRDALPSTLETLLRMNGATMVKESGLYKIVPQAAAVRGNVTPQLGSSQRALPAGYSVQIVPLRYVGVREMLRLLEPFARDAAAMRGDELRNLLILSGTERELRHLLEAVDMFDIDWMAGMSAGVFVLQSADVKTVVVELDKVLGGAQNSPLGGILRVVPIERMNALLVITPQPAYLEKAKEWITRLDQGTQGEGLRFFVFNLQNQRAERIAPLLQQAFTGRPPAQTTSTAPTVAPGTPAGQIVSPPSFQAQTIVQPNTPQAVAPPAATAATTAAATAAATAATAARGGVGDGTAVVRNVQVVADKDNNTILIVATQAEYTVIEAALKKLDVPSRQVMIDVTIAEVALTNEFSLGVEWFFSHNTVGTLSREAGGLFSAGTNPGNVFARSTDAAAGVGIGPRVPGFNYLLRGAFPGGVQAAIRALETSGNTRIVANPQVAALDNQKATIKVGDRIPINQQTIVSGTSNAVTTTSQYVDTGVLLTVTPHINAGGLVTLDVSAEVSNPGPAAAGEAPPINTRSVQTILNVHSGRTMVMGGLIRDNKVQSNSGLPLLSRIPVLGGLFGDQTTSGNRTELVLFVTPRVVETEIDMKDVMDDLRRRMERLEDVFPGARNRTQAPAER